MQLMVLFLRIPSFTVGQSDSQPTNDTAIMIMMDLRHETSWDFLNQGKPRPGDGFESPVALSK